MTKNKHQKQTSLLVLMRMASEGIAGALAIAMPLSEQVVTSVGGWKLGCYLVGAFALLSFTCSLLYGIFQERKDNALINSLQDALEKLPEAVRSQIEKVDKETPQE